MGLYIHVLDLVWVIYSSFLISSTWDTHSLSDDNAKRNPIHVCPL